MRDRCGSFKDVTRTWQIEWRELLSVQSWVLCDTDVPLKVAHSVLASEEPQIHAQRLANTLQRCQQNFAKLIKSCLLSSKPNEKVARDWGQHRLRWPSGLQGCQRCRPTDRPVQRREEGEDEEIQNYSKSVLLAECSHTFCGELRTFEPANIREKSKRTQEVWSRTPGLAGTSGGSITLTQGPGEAWHKDHTTHIVLAHTLKQLMFVHFTYGFSSWWVSAIVDVNWLNIKDYNPEYHYSVSANVKSQLADKSWLQERQRTCSWDSLGYVLKILHKRFSIARTLADLMYQLDPT